MIETQNARSDRGGIQLHDYTQGSGRRMALKKFSFDKVARALILVSLGLGLMEVLMPRRVQKMVGVRRGKHNWLIRAAGLREIMSGLMILMQPRPSRAMWSRVLGDAMDLGLLGAAFNMPRAEKNRLAIATASIAGITALDALTAVKINRELAVEKRASDMTQADLSGRTRGGAFRVLKSITINSSPNELYMYWRNFENLPQFMYHLQSVQVLDNRRSHWVTKAPAGRQVEWDAEITDDRPNELIAWQSTSGDVPNSGVVRFEPRPEGRGTVVRVEIDYRPPAGRIGKIVAALFGEDASQQVKGDLGRFKQIMETGEVMRSDASQQGLGQKMQHPAQPARAEESIRGNKSREKYTERMPRSETERSTEREGPLEL